MRAFLEPRLSARGLHLVESRLSVLLNSFDVRKVEIEPNVDLNVEQNENGHRLVPVSIDFKVGTAGFEPTASCAQK
jgi:plastocyanin domain-containing protein